MSELIIERANMNDAQEILDLYNRIIDKIKGQLYRPDWHRDLYPVLNHVLQAISQGEMWVARTDGKILSAMVLNHTHNESYDEIQWQKDLKDDEIFVLHLLGVDPGAMRKGIASKMVEFAKDLARQQGLKAIRLDVFNRNVHAEQMYLKHGFKIPGTVRQRYKETNWKYSNLFECLI